MKRPANRWLFVLAFVGGLALRSVRLGSRPLWYDEAFSILLSRQELPQIIAGTAADTMPPLYYLLLHAWMGLGQDIAFLRLLNVILGGLVLLLAYLWGNQLGGRKTGIWLLALAAISPFLIYHAQELRMYSLLALTTLGYVLLVARWTSSEGARSLWTGVGIATTGALALYSHNLAGFTLLVPSVVLMLKGKWRTTLRLALPQLGAILLFFPWLMYVPAQVDKIQSAFWTPLPGFLEAVQAVVTLHTNLPVPDSLLPLALFGSLTTVSFLAYGIIRFRVMPSHQSSWLVAYTLIPPLVLFALSYLMRPVFVARAFILSAVAYYGILALFLVSMSQKTLRLLIVVSFTLPIVVSLPAQYRYAVFPRSPFDEAAAYLRRHSGENDQIVHDNKLSFFPMEVYAPELPMIFLADEPGSHNDTLAPESQDALELWPVDSLAQVTDEAEVVWFVVFERAIDEYLAQGLGDHPRVRELRTQYEQVREERFNDLLLLKFQQR